METQTLILTLIAVILVFTLFQGFYSMKYGVQKSISASIFVLQGNEKLLYSFMILVTAIGFGVIGNTPLGWTAAFLLGIDSFAVGTHDNKVQNYFHNYGATFGIGFGLAMLLIDFDQWYLVLAYVIFFLYAIPKGTFKRKWLLWLNWFTKFKLENSTTWNENAAFVVVCIGLALHIKSKLP